MTYEEATAWLRAHGGSISTSALGEGGEVIATANRISRVATAKDLSDRSEVRRCEVEAIEELKVFIES
jgi:hypothetical protein